MFSFVFKDTDLSEKQIEWICHRDLEKYYMILCYEGRFNFSSLKLPINIIPFINNSFFYNLFVKIKIFFNFLYFSFFIFFDLRSHVFVRKHYLTPLRSKRIMNLYFLYYEIKILKNYYSKKNYLFLQDKKIFDDMNLSKDESFGHLSDIENKRIILDVHGGGYFVYNSIVDIYFHKYAAGSHLREDFFFGIHNALKQNKIDESQSSSGLNISFAPYFFDKNNIIHCGQEILGLRENIKFFQALSESYDSKDNNLIIRDPSKASRSFLGKFRKNYKKRFFFL